MLKKEMASLLEFVKWDFGQYGAGFGLHTDQTCHNFLLRVKDRFWEVLLYFWYFGTVLEGMSSKRKVFLMCDRRFFGSTFSVALYIYGYVYNF